MDGKGFFHSTTALITALSTMLAALVALGVFLLGEGIFAPSGQGGDASVPGGAPKLDGAVQDQETFGRNGTTAFEFDGSKIVRNPGGNSRDVAIYEALNQLTVYQPGRIIAWTEEKAPTQQECAKLLDTHGAAQEYVLEIGARFCVLSSGGRTAFLAIVSDGAEYHVTVWKQP